MPWTARDAKGHTRKANTPEKQRGWAKTANSALKRCLAGGGSKGVCEGRAIRIANAAVTKMGEGEDSMKSTRGFFTSGTATVEISALDVGGKKVPVNELIETYLAGAPLDASGVVDDTTTGTGFTEADSVRAAIALLSEYISGSLDDFTSQARSAFYAHFEDRSAYAPGPANGHYVKDVFKDNADFGDTIAVETKGKLYLVEYEYSDDDASFAFADRSDWKQVRLTYVPYVAVGASEADVGFVYHGEGSEAELSESASGHALGLAEGDGRVAASAGQRAPLLMDVALIRPGWGNKRDNHYYTRELLKRDAKVFEGAKMYTTDHRAGEKSVRTEVSVVKEIKGFTTDGAPIASVAVHDPDFAEATRNRRALGTLESLECSILAGGRVRKGTVEGRKGGIVEAITSVTSVDWVTKAGAGGHAIALAENISGGVNMDKEQVKRLLSESDLPQDVQKRLVGVEYKNEEAVKEAILAEAKPKVEPKVEPVVEPKVEPKVEPAVTYLAEAKVKEALEASKLPKQAQVRLTEGEYLDEEALKAAVDAERAYIKELTGSGRPFAQGGSAAPEGGAEVMSEAEYDAEYNDILGRHGCMYAQTSKQEVK